MYRKLYSSDEVRTHWQDAEWNKGPFFPTPPLPTDPASTSEAVPPSDPSPPVTEEGSNVKKPEDTKEPPEDSMELPIKQRRQQKRLTPEEIANQISEVAASIAERTPSYTQKIIAEQVQLGGTYYSQVATQSQQSFDLARMLSIIGAVLFVASMVVMIIPFANGNTTVVGSLGVVVAGIVEAVAGLSFLYNKASAQFARFHIFLDRINRASLCHTMCNELEDQGKKQEIMVNIIQELLKKDG
jgi:hypothetical protein